MATTDPVAFLVPRLVRRHQWTAAKATEVVEEYHRFMQLKKALKDYEATRLSPSSAIDLVWHEHILDTRRYGAFCTQLCGRLIHHDPDGDLDPEERAKRLKVLSVLAPHARTHMRLCRPLSTPTRLSSSVCHVAQRGWVCRQQQQQV